MIFFENNVLFLDKQKFPYLFFLLVIFAEHNFWTEIWAQDSIYALVEQCSIRNHVIRVSTNFVRLQKPWPHLRPPTGLQRSIAITGDGMIRKVIRQLRLRLTAFDRGYESCLSPRELQDQEG